MRVRPFVRPNNATRFSTLWFEGTAAANATGPATGAIVLLFAAAAATVAIGFREPRVDYCYETVVFLAAACWRLRPMPLIPGMAFAAIAAWGFFQLSLGATVYRSVTLQCSLRYAALAATGWISFRVFEAHRLRMHFLRAFAWFGAIVAVVSVVAYFTSPGKILWLFDAPYPDVWGPFLSRNNFAQFLELSLPVALWLALQETEDRGLYLCFAAVMLAAGLASASRAGGSILLIEMLTMLWMYRQARQIRGMAISLVLGTALFAAMPGVGTLVGRLSAPDPFQDRREIADSTLQMIAARPFRGFGLGTFATVYPEYAVFDVGRSVDHAHNDWLEWSAEGGIPWALVWLSLAAWCAKQASRAGWGLGILGCFLHSVVDYPFARIGIASWIFILAGMLAATGLREVRRKVH